MPVVATPENATVTTPSAWLVEVGTAPAWQSEHATGLEREPFTCTWCTPTPCAVVTLLPFVSTGGAAWKFASAPNTATRLASPWQLVQVMFCTSSTPLRCSVAFTICAPVAGLSPYPVWQELQALFCGCGEVGGSPWQLVQVSDEVPAVNVPVQAGVVFVPPPTAVVPPWQYTVAQVSAVVFQAGVTLPVLASAPKVTAAVPLAWVWSPAGGTVWHSVQAMGFARNVFWLRCAWWAPTARAVVAVSPFEPMGGAATVFASAPAIGVRAPSPWHCVQPVRVETTATAPSMWVEATTVVCE